MAKGYELFEGLVINTGWPIDGHTMLWGLWDYDSRQSYHLCFWGEEDDEAVMLTMFRTLVDGGFISEGDKDDFIKAWHEERFDDEYCPGPFVIGLDKLADVRVAEAGNGTTGQNR